MAFDIVIRRNSDGLIRTYKFDDIDWQENTLDWLTIGNFGCDCNRYLSFERAAGRDPWDDEAEDQEGRCSDGRYTIIKAVLPDGTEIPVDNVEE